MNKKVILMILDGWGIADNPEVSAINSANTPFMDQAWGMYPHSRLNASGLAVGLPVGQMGNSEVGHMNIGAGRVVYQDLVMVNKAIEDDTLEKNTILQSTFEHVKKSGKKLHFIGLVSDGGVHSHIDHLKGLCALAQHHSLSDQIWFMLSPMEGIRIHKMASNIWLIYRNSSAIEEATWHQSLADITRWIGISAGNVSERHTMLWYMGKECIPIM